MSEPSKIRVICFSGSADAQWHTPELLAEAEPVKLIAAFRGNDELSALLAADCRQLLKRLAPEVVVFRLAGGDYRISELQLLKSLTGSKLIGLLSGESLNDHALLSVLDYHSEAGAECVMSDADINAKLLYQIKSARLALATKAAGIHGKWAVLPLPQKTKQLRSFDLIAIGASTGGTEALSAILAELKGKLPPIVVVQHMPENFTDFFAKNLASKIKLPVIAAKGGEVLSDCTVYIAGGDKHLEVVRNGSVYRTKCVGGEKISGHRPSVDALFASVAKAAGAAAIGVILTGMGRDGAAGLLQMREAGAYTIGQDKASSAVYGMPMAAFALGAVSKQLPLGFIAKAIESAAHIAED